MPADLEQVASHDVPLVGHPLHRHGLHRRLRLPRAQHGAGPTGPGEATPKTHPRLLLTPLLDGIRHNGTVRPTGTLSMVQKTPFHSQIRLMKLRRSARDLDWNRL